MGLRLKTASTISAIFLAVIGVTYLLFSLGLLAEFKTLERARTAKNLDRVSQALESVHSDLGKRALDWGHWDESLSFIRGENPQYVESNLNFEALVPFELKHVIFLKRDGSLLFGAEAFPESASMGPLSGSVLDSLHAHDQFAQFLRSPSDGALTGMVVIDNRPTFVAASTVTDSKMQELPEGFIIFTRELSEKLQDHIRNQTLLPLAFRAPSGADAFFSSAISSSTAAVSESADSITAVGAIRDISGRHIASVEFSQPRDILAQGIAARNSLMAVIALFLFLANGVVLLFVDRTILKPLSRFSRRLDTISKTNDLSLKLPVDRNDEIGRLSGAFNGLTDSLQLSYQRVHEARVAAQDANDAKSAFIATVSHELRTPIHSITGMLRILKQHEPSDTRRGFIDMANQAAFGLLATINEILDFTQTESGQLSLESAEFDLREVVERAANNAGTSRGAAADDVEMIVDVAPEVPRILVGDGHRLGQVLTNLLGNARKFTHEGHVALLVGISRPIRDGRATITFTVEDTGIGIPPEQAENIFRPFHQGAPSTARLYQGSGLGLSIVKQIVERMGGVVTVASEQHRGTTCAVSIPFMLGASPESPREPGTVALVMRSGAAASIVASAARRHTRHVEAFNPEKRADMESLANRAAAFSRIVLWSPNRNDFALLLPVLNAANGVAVVATMRAEDLSLREQLASMGVASFFEFSATLERVLSGGAAPDASGLERSAAAKLNAGDAAGPRLKVLIADDTPTNCIILQSMLEEAGHSVEVVTNGLDLLNRLRPIAVGDDSAAQFDLVLTDIQMPLMDGNTAVRQLRLLEEGSGSRRRLPVVAVTAHALPDEQQEMRQAGMDGIVTKPVSPAELSRVISACSQKSSALAPQPDPATCVEQALRRVVRDVCGSPAPGRDTIDISGVFERSGKSLRRTRMILRAFLSAYGAPRDTLARAIAQRDLRAASRAAHTLKGLLLDVGASSLAEAASALECRCKEPSFSVAAQEETSRLITTIGGLASLVDRIVRSMPKT